MVREVGTRIGSYEIIAPLGKGGMGEVFRARDLELEREVALKLLPRAFASDPDRLQRFEREAKALAALNDSRIAQIYGFLRVDETSALVMELVEGEDLSERISRGPIPLDEALSIALQIAQALEAAHSQGITHRDLKPANVKVRPDGAVKVLDFGLAKLRATSSAGVGGASGEVDEMGETRTSPAAASTAAGTILGTASYMSPEQARGRPVDQRSDIWAFGCILFEMLSGRRPFVGETVTDILATVVKSEPDWSSLPKETPAAIRTLIRRCLRKDPTRRLRDIGDARLEIADPIAEETVRDDAAAPSRIGWFGAAIAIVAALGAGLWWGRTLVPASVQWTGEQLGGPQFAVHPRSSPDGQLLAFITLEDGQSQVAVMQPGAATWAVLTHDKTNGLAYSLNWSRDGSRILYFRSTDVPTGIFAVPALGGEERLVLENASFPVPLPDGSLLVARRNADRLEQLHRFWPSTGELEPLPALLTDFDSGEWIPLVATPDGRRAVFGGWSLDDADRTAALYVMDLETKRSQRLAPGTELRAAVNVTQPTNDAVLFGTYEGDVFRIFRASLDGSSAVPLFMLPRRVTLDWAPDGSVITSLGVRPVELLGMPPSGDSVERLPVVPSMTRNGIAPLSGGRYLVTSRIGDHDRVLVVARDRQPGPLVDTSEDTRFPAAAIRHGHAVVTIGPETSPDLAVVGIEDGRIVRRFASPAPQMSSLDASPDGATLYYAAEGAIWSTSADGSGTPSRLTAGDSLAVDPKTGDLVVKLDAPGRFELVRLRKGSSTPEPIVLRGDLRLVFPALMPGSVRGGRLVLAAASNESWYFHAAAVDLESGELVPIRRGDPYDFHLATWGSEGEVVGLSSPQQETLWRFRPIAGGGPASRSPQGH